MNAPTAIPKFPRGKRWQALVGLVVLLVAVWTAWYLTSDRFREFVRQRVVTRIEEVSGGKVELKAFRWDLSQMEFEADGLDIHGREKPGEPAFAHFDRIYARIKVISLFRKEIDLRYLSITQPSIHLIVYPDGTTNQPVPKVRAKRDNPLQPLFEAAVGKLEVQRGELLVNEQRLPLDFDANDVSVRMDYDPAAKSFDGNLHLGRAEAKLKDWRPLPLHGDISFKLFENRAHVQSLSLVSGKSHLEANGDLHDFVKPLVELAYTAHLEGKEIAGIARLRNVKGGNLDLTGQGRWSLEHFATTGKAQLQGLLYADAVVRDVSVTGKADYIANEKRLTLDRLTAQLWNGNVAGSVEVENWLEASNSGTNGTADLAVRNIRLHPLAQAVSTRQLPLDQLNLAGEASGSVAVRWRGSPSNAVAKLDLSTAPLQEAEPGVLPVSGRLRGNFFAQSEKLQFDEFELSTPNTSVVAKGTMGSSDAQLQIALDSKNITEFQPLIDSISGPDSPLLLNGATKFTGTISGRMRTPVLTGHVELHDFSTVLPRNLHSHERQVIRWDSLAGELHYSPEQISLVRAYLKRGPAGVNFDASAMLISGKLTENSMFDLRANIREAEVADLLRVAGFSYPFSGRLNGALQLSGTADTLNGTAHIEWSDGSAYGEPFRRARADFQVKGRALQAQHFEVSAPAGEIVGTGAFNFDSSRYNFQVRGAELRLEQFQFFHDKRINVQGKTSFEASGEGTPGSPVLNAKIQFRKIVLSGEPVGDLQLDATTRGEDLIIRGRSDFLDASLGLDGSIRLRDGYRAHVLVDFSNLDADPLVRGYLKQFRLTSHTLLAGHFQIEGPLRDWTMLSADGSIRSFAAGVENVKIVNEGPVHLSLNRQVVTIENLHLLGEGTNFSAAGTIGLADARPINVRANGSLNLRILQSFGPEYTTSGMTTLDMRVAGTIAHPQLRGRIQIRDGAISYVDLPNGLSGINGSMIFTEDRLQVQSLTARTGGGELVLGGFIAYSNELTFNLTARGKDIRLRYPPGVSSSGDANLTLAGTPKNALLSGEITVTRFGLNPRFDFAGYVARSKQPISPVKADSPLNGLRLDIHVVSTSELQVETSLAKVTGNVDLHLRGSGAKPVVLGRVNIIEGDLTFNSTTYHLERGEISFSNPTYIEPVLDIEATAHVRDYDITLGFHGPVEHLSTNYRSDPPLPTADIIALLALGRTRQESAQAQMYNPQQTTITESASNELLGQALNATVSSRVQKLFGVSRIKIDPQVGGPENTSNARLTIEQQVSNKVTLTYITNLSQSAQQIIQMEYNITRDVSILAVRDQNGIVGFDVRIRQRKK